MKKNKYNLILLFLFTFVMLFFVLKDDFDDILHALLNIKYYYIDIYEWISSRLHHMTNCGRKNFHKDLDNYISEANTAEKVKLLWNELHQK